MNVLSLNTFLLQGYQALFIVIGKESIHHEPKLAELA